MPPLARVTVFCFAASYGVALALDLWRLARPRLILRVVSLLFGAAGLFAHLIYLIVQAPPLVSSNGSLLFLAFVLGVFWFYGSLHHQRVAWGVFVLPLVLGLIGLSQFNPTRPSGEEPVWASLKLMPFWSGTHGVLLLLASVGICVGFVASVMYFVQVYRLRSKTLPGQGLKLMSLERLEQMNRRAILWAFPLLTLGLVVGVGIQLQHGEFLEGWMSPKILSTLGLWLVFAILLFLRYGAHVRGQKVALLTIVAFGVLLVALATAHPFLDEVTP
jgi:ABC-type transport system involved in cytochrome c biogenesis permease subunit